MSIKLYSRYHIPVPLSTEFPKRLKEYEIGRAKKWMATEDENIFLFQELPGDGFTIRFQNLNIQNPTVFTIDSPGSICFQVSMYRTLEYELSGLDTNMMIYHRRFNLISASTFSARYKVVKPKSRFVICELWLTKEFLRPFVSKYPAIGTFLNDIEKGRPVQLYEQGQKASVEMMALIDLIVVNGNDFSADPDWLSVYVSGILENSFRINEKNKRIKVGSDVLNRIYEIVDVLHGAEDIDSAINQVSGNTDISPYKSAKHLDDWKKELNNDNWSVDDLAAYAGMSVYKLEQLFKEVYSCTINEFKRRRDWQFALIMLLSKSANLKSISAYTGFYTQSAFNRAFKKRFGSTPVEYVQDWEKKLKKLKKMAYRNYRENLEDGHQTS